LCTKYTKVKNEKCSKKEKIKKLIILIIINRCNDINLSTNTLTSLTESHSADTPQTLLITVPFFTMP